MAVWKQLLLALLILVAVGAAWVRYFPGAPELVARYAPEWAAAAAVGLSGEAPAGDRQAGGAPEGAASARGAAGSGDGAPRAAQQREGQGRERQGGQRGQRGPGGGAPMPVVTSPVITATINDRLSAIGTGRAAKSVSVTPYASGRLVELKVRSGGEVTAGDMIGSLDAEAETIALDRARIALDDAQARLERVTQLRSSKTATTVQVEEAELALQNARLELRDAELALERRSIVAPISGVVGILPITAGNYVSTTTEIATIDDRSSILVDFWVPERYAGVMAVGAPLQAALVARPDQVFEGTVTAIDNRVDEASRTLRVEAGIANTDDMLRAGMSFQVSMRFAGETFPAVNPLAIQWGTEGAFVWAVRAGKAERTPVRIIQRNTESVLVEAGIGEGDMVVTEGVHTVRQGAEVLVASREPVAGATGATRGTAPNASPAPPASPAPLEAPAPSAARKPPAGIERAAAPASGS